MLRKKVVGEAGEFADSKKEEKKYKDQPQGRLVHAWKS